MVGAAASRRGRPRPRPRPGRPAQPAVPISLPVNRCRASSSGSMPAARWSALSSPDHTPATVGRSWVVMAASAWTGYSAWRGVLEPRHPHRQHAGVVQAARTSGSTVPRSSPTTTAPARMLSTASTARSSSPGSGRRRRRRGPPPGGSSRNSPITWSIRQAAAPAQRGPPQRGQGPVAGGPQGVGHERQAPVLAGAVELVGRRADPHAAGQQVLERPGVAPSGSTPMARFGQQAGAPRPGRADRRPGTVATA